MKPHIICLSETKFNSNNDFDNNITNNYIKQTIDRNNINVEVVVFQYMY